MGPARVSETAALGVLIEESVVEREATEDYGCSGETEMVK